MSGHASPAGSPPPGAGIAVPSSPVPNKSTLPTHSTPRTAKVASYEVFETTVSDLKKTRQRILHETTGHFVGPMPVKEFFDDFMPWNDGVNAAYKKVDPPQSRIKRLKGLPQCSEADSYTEFVKSFQDWRGLAAPKGMPRGSTSPLRFEDSHKHCDRDCASYSVDISVYSGVPFVPREKEQVMDFANLHCWVEIKPSAEYDAFSDVDPNKKDGKEGLVKDKETHGAEQDGSVENESEDGGVEDNGVEDDEETPDISHLDRAAENPERPRNFEATQNKSGELVVEGKWDRFPFEKATKRACDTRAQLASYAGATMATQYRNHLFSVLIAGKGARLVRWERASAIVSESFDFTERPLILFEFFKRFRQLTLQQRGSNPKVGPATKKEAADARDLLQKLAPELWLGAAGSLFLKNDSIDIKTQPFLKLRFLGHTFIVPAPHCPERGLSPFGRASRGSAAVMIDGATKEKSVCFLKDGWRDAHRISEPEIYALLEEHKVRNVAKMLCGGDFPASTIGLNYASREWALRRATNKIRDLQSCMIVLDVIGRPLVAFRKAHHLIGAFADAMEAYTDAYHDAHIMHRDISPHNILIVNTDSGHKGILIDWDHGILVQPPPTETGPWRTGTWQFMSISLLKDPRALHSILDDYESVFWVLLWIVIRHLYHNLDQADLCFMLEMFDEQTLHLKNYDYLGGTKKFNYILARDALRVVVKENISEITDLLKDLTVNFTARYTGPDPFIQARPALLEAWEKECEEQLTRLGGRDWLVERLRATDKKLKERQDANTGDEDWTDNVTDAAKLGVPPEMLPLRQSRLFLNYTGQSSMKRTAEQEGQGDKDAPKAKRTKTSSALD